LVTAARPINGDLKMFDSKSFLTDCTGGSGEIFIGQEMEIIVETQPNELVVEINELEIIVELEDE
jgi:hypothetical protein